MASRVVVNMNGARLWVTPHIARIASIALKAGIKLCLKGASA